MFTPLTTSYRAEAHLAAGDHQSAHQHALNAVAFAEQNGNQWILNPWITLIRTSFAVDDEAGTLAAVAAAQARIDRMGAEGMPNASREN